MTIPEFDRHATEYDRMHRANIAVTGEEPAFFAEYKIRAFAGHLARAGLRPGPVLDFGAGIGNSIPWFQAHLPEAALTSADVSGESLALAERRHPGAATFVQIPGQTLPFSDVAFDAAFTACVFHHIPAQDHIHWLAELRRTTRPGGLLAVAEHNPRNPLTVRAVNTCPSKATPSALSNGSTRWPRRITSPLMIKCTPTSRSERSSKRKRPPTWGSTTNSFS